MKGTIDAHIPDAETKVLSDYKELSEHYTIVDLIRNDLSMVASLVRVERFRYIDRIETSNGPILEVSSEIKGDLPSDWKNRLGEIIRTLLPAGSQPDPEGRGSSSWVLHRRIRLFRWQKF